MADTSIKIFIANDHSLYIAGLRNALAEYKHISIVDTAGTYNEVLQKLPQRAADILILDDQMPDGELFHTITEVKRQWPEMKIIMHSMMDARALHIRKTFEYINGWFAFYATADEIIKTIESVYCGGIAINIKGFDREI